MEKRIIVAIDGHSSCGKSTMAKRLAEQIGYAYIDTGAMYRAVTLYALRQGLISGNEIDQASLAQALPTLSITFQRSDEGVNLTLLNGEVIESAIRSTEVSSHVSLVSSLAFVRHAMVDQQRRAGADKGVVLDGRDIGTVVFPHAELKIFLTASPQVRAERRWRELIAKGEQITVDAVETDLIRRDHLDSTRAESPLRRADDALLLDNSAMTIEQQNQWLAEAFGIAVAQANTTDQA